VVERVVQSEVVAALLAVGLEAIEVVDRGGDDIAHLLVGTDGVQLMAEGEQDLERDHDFVVLDEVADQEEDFFLGHGGGP
jgi:hypothetical protein